MHWAYFPRKDTFRDASGDEKVFVTLQAMEQTDNIEHNNRLCGSGKPETVTAIMNHTDTGCLADNAPK